MRAWRHLVLLLVMLALASCLLPAYLQRAELQLWLLGPAWCG